MSDPRYRFRGNARPTTGARASILTGEAADGVASLRLYDPIDSWGGDWGVSAKEFTQALAGLPADTTEIRLHINSPGGEVFEAIAILNQLRQHKARIVAVVDGLAASAASFLAAGADEVIMGRNSQLMVHDAWGFAIGNAADMHAVADSLDKISGNIASIYADKAGGTPDEWRDVMRAETWMTAEEAVEAGLADRMDEPAQQPAAENRFDLTVFQHAGRAQAPDPATILPRRSQPAARAGSTNPPAEPKDTTNPEEKGPDAMSEKLIQGLRARLGIPAASELDDDGLLAAVDEALAEQETPAAAAAPGTVVLDAAQYEDLQAAAAEGRTARQEQLAANRVALVNAAVNDGRITPARREHWLNTLAADPGMADTLAGLEKGLVPLAAAGYTGGVDEATDEDKVYSKFYPGEEA